MIGVGVTGSFASGKSFLLNYLAKQGLKVFSADECVKELYQQPRIQQKILNLLPALKTFNKIKIAGLIYSDDKARNILEGFIHPLVLNELAAFKQHHQQEKYIFAEIALLFEAGFDKYFDFIVTTVCREESRLRRAQERENFNQGIYNKIQQLQLPPNEKALKADFIINTDVSLEELDQQVNNLIKRIK